MKPIQTLLDWCTQNHAELLLQHYLAGNNALPPEEIGFSSGKVVAFRCPVCNMEWRRSLNKATRASADQGCPYCAHRRPGPFYNLATQYPELAKQWDYEKNAGPPAQYLPTQKQKVYWTCECGHHWSAAIRDRVKSAERARKKGTPLCPFCSGKRTSSSYNLTTEYPDIARQWDYARNAGRKPEDFPPASAQKVWWHCSYNPAHHWEARISNRTLLERGCPHCAREFKMSYPARVLFYYLQQAVPDCVCEEPFQKRYKVDICLPSIKVAIEHDGFYYHTDPAAQKRAHEKDLALWKAGYRVLRVCDSKELQQPVLIEKDTVLYRFDERHAYFDDMVAGVFCYLSLAPVDIDHKRDRFAIEDRCYHERKKHTLAVEHPELARELSDRNPDPPDAIASQSSRKMWWLCPVCKMEYQSTVVNRVNRHSGCPYCANLRAYEKNYLAVQNPEVAGQWHPTRNGALTPHDVVPGSERKAYWRCPKGHEWQASIYSRTSSRASGCPICAHRQVHPDISLQTLNPALAKLWHPSRNAPLFPAEVTAYSNKCAWWQCEKGHEWQQTVNSLQKVAVDKRCPYCSGRKANKATLES